MGGRNEGDTEKMEINAGRMRGLETKQRAEGAERRESQNLQHVRKLKGKCRRISLFLPIQRMSEVRI